MSKSIVPASNVRAFYNDPKSGAARVARFGLADDKSIKPGARGRLSPAAIAGFNKGKPSARHYVTGNTLVVTAEAKGEAASLRVKAAEAGLPVGKRGPLTNEARKALGLKVAKRKASAPKA